MKNRIVFGSLLVALLIVAIVVGGYVFRAMTLLICVLAVHETAGTIMKKPDPLILLPSFPTPLNFKPPIIPSIRIVILSIAAYL